MYSQIFKLHAVTTLYQKLGVLCLLMTAVLPFVLPEMTNYHVDDRLLAPARAQVVWQFSWIVVVFWLLYHAATSGAEYVQSGLAAYYTSSGLSKGGQLTMLWMSCMIYGVLLCLISAVVTVVFASPQHELESRHWLVLVVQQFSLMLIVVSAFVSFALALGSRLGGTIGYVGSLGVFVWSFYGVKMVQNLVVAKDSFVVDWLYIVSPHGFLSDLTHRFVHKQGAMASSEFMALFEYLAGWCLVASALSLFMFNSKQR
ncbi:hypothetical protein Rhal01_03376 [Rubritalea halochordaticola]|uniref:ABC transporter permease n=1 Tax=Rubritalea halochordaticola TaxID=714537 RepID=A0ABP9V3F1_9BACT